MSRPHIIQFLGGGREWLLTQVHPQLPKHWKPISIHDCLPGKQVARFHLILLLHRQNDGADPGLLAGYGALRKVEEVVMPGLPTALSLHRSFH